MKRIHYYSGIIISIYTALHLGNHVLSLGGPALHIQAMEVLRLAYRNIVVESCLLGVVLLQIVSGLRLYVKRRHTVHTFFEKLQIYTGLYLAFFFVMHVSAVLGGRYLLGLDTNFYFGVAGLNLFPYNLYFIPYYGLAILSFFGHIAAVHAQKARSAVLGIAPVAQAKGIILLGFVVLMLIFCGLTNTFTGVDLPARYHQLLNK